MRAMLLGILALSVVRVTPAQNSGFLEQLTGRKAGTNAAASSSSLKNLTHEQLAQGLKEALTNGVQHAIAELGHEGGFLTNLNVKIPMPEKLRTVEKTLRELKQDKLADDF